VPTPRVLTPALALCLACAGLGAPASPPPSVPTLGVGAAPAGDMAPPPPAPPASPPHPPAALPEAAGPTFPLTAGDAWRWEVVRSTGAGVRVLLMTSEPARTERIAVWELSIGEPEASGRYPATFVRTPVGDGLPSTTAMTLFHASDGSLRLDAGAGTKPALELTVPPNPVSVEHVPCVAHLLGGLTAVCSPAPGGPLAVAPGPVRVSVRQDRDGAAAVAQVLIGIATAGTIIPGNRSSREVATLVEHKTTRPPAATSPEVAAFRARPSPSALRGDGPLDRETAAALIALSDASEAPAVIELLAPRLAERDRWPALRVATQKAADPDAQLAAIARAARAAPLTDRAEFLPSLLANLPEAEASAATALVEGRWPLLTAVVLAAPPERAPLVARRVDELKPSGDEAKAVLRRVDETRAADRLRTLETLLPALSTADADALMLETLADDGLFDRRFDLLERQTAWVERQAADPDRAGALLGSFTFDADRARALTLVLQAARPPDRPTLLRVGVQAMAFDDGRLAVLTEHAALVDAMSARDRNLAIAAFVFEKQQARALLAR
jgi:hypothetical protein